jgi:hypothetical protein
MDSTREGGFIDQTVRFHASGGDLDALVGLVSPDSHDVVLLEGGSTRLYMAANRGWCRALRWLIEHGANVNHARHHSGCWTALHTAALGDKREAALLLLDAGARVDDFERNGLTALHLAAANSNSKMCKLLLSRGASLDTRDNQYGQDPEARARLHSNVTTADFLAAVRAAGGWLPWLNAPRKELLALRRRLPALRERGRAAPSSSVRAHERLFLDVPDGVFSHVLAFWRSDRDD